MNETASAPANGVQAVAVQQLKPILVKTSVAKSLIGVGHSKFWDMVKKGEVDTVKLAGLTMVVYASLEALAKPRPKAA